MEIRPEAAPDAMRLVDQAVMVTDSGSNDK
jgi:hypothetical protein